MRQIIKYLIGGGTAAAIDLVLLYIFTHWFGLWYLQSAILSFTFAFIASFLLQKFWTFGDHDTSAPHLQTGVYLAIQILNLCLTLIIMYILVDIMGVHYLTAKIIVAGSLAVYSYFVYKYFIFHNAHASKK